MAQGDNPDVKFALEEPDSQNLDSISQWCASINDACENHNCNPFASTSFVCSPVTLVDAVGPGSCDSDWFSHSGSDSDSDPDISCFVTDLFERGSSEQRDGYSDPNSGLSLNEFEIGGCSEGVDFELGERSGPRGVDSIVEGLRIVEFDSESDSEDGSFGVLGFNSLHDNESRNVSNNRVNNWDIQRPSNDPCLEDQRSLSEDFDWEEVEERVTERENLSIVIDDDVEEEVPIEEDEEYAEQAARNIEWEILLAINNLATNSSLERNVDSGTESYFSVQDDYIYAVGVEYETLFEQFIESESALKGSPPAAKSVVENLPFVELTVEELQKDDVVCAVCKDKILVEEKVKRLPCCHYYHGDCIVPWLGIRNTCPVCRYELPTDDPDYERRKSQRAHRVSPTDSQVTFNFELFA
ncbi:E3 ubiquitin ligase BIG BROTHER-related [Humulus lupulus]|uniref:E3 ubiquitin ligase BIG BROTHER-related n=1 Tax=Humulus lupulus TaxID=3486 RepID=UPI002B40BD55|nr:E3 ubiquitin ligase BIG BROTHER-related [Humulus lupulus]